MKTSEDDRSAYAPGEIVPDSGIYMAVHGDHRPEHEVVAIRGEQFPFCRVCRDEVRFYVARTVPHMMHDFDLTGPRESIFKKQARAAKKGTP